MGLQKKINDANRDMQKKKLLEQPGMEVYGKLQAFYKLHPYSTPAVKEEVDRIRADANAFSKALEEKFESEHARLVVEFMQKELDYLESYLSPNQKKQDEQELYVGPGMPRKKKYTLREKVKNFIKSIAP